MPRIPLVEELTTGPIPLGSQLLVEYDPASQWHNASLTITAGWLKSGGISATYNTYVQSPDEVRSGLERLGLDIASLEKEDKFGITNYYSTTLGQKPDRGIFLKVSEESIRYLAEGMKAPPAPGHLTISDDESTYARFNDEKAWVELELTRYLPGSRMRKITQVIGVMMGTQSDWAYKRLEGACDGIIDFKLEETSGRTRSVMRIRKYASRKVRLAVASA